MPASLLSMNLRGIRSYSPYEHKKQEIEFMPLTLIIGKNGSGKTTLIESLKFMISGEEPPLSDSRRNFIHTSKNQQTNTLDKNVSYASIELTFQNARNETCTARREINKLSTGKTATPSISSSFKILDRPWTHVHKQDDWNKTVPLLFNLPNQALLNNVVLCHQEHNQWCMGDSSNVKLIFDKIFGCEKYKNEIKHIEAEIKNCKNELAVGEKEVAFDKERVTEKKKLIDKLESMRTKKEEFVSSIETLDRLITSSNAERETLSRELSEHDLISRDVESLRQKLEFSKNEADKLRESLIRNQAYFEPESVSDEELNLKLKDHTKLTEEAKQRQSLLYEQELSLKTNLKKCEVKKASLQDEVNKLKVLALKSTESHSALLQMLEKIKKEQSLEELSTSDIHDSLEILEKFEKNLLQNKSDQSELEDNLSAKLQKLSKTIANLEGIYQGLLHKIKGKENIVKRLSIQLAQADPTANDLVSVVDKLEKMSFITAQLPRSDLTNQLDSLIDESKTLLKARAEQIKSEGISELNNAINKENSEIKEGKSELKATLSQKEELSTKQSQIEDEHQRVRVASKEAHNKALVFKNARSAVITAFHNYNQEKAILESKNVEAKEKELDEMTKAVDTNKAELEATSNELIKLSNLISQNSRIPENYQSNIQLRAITTQLNTLNERMTLKEKNLSSTKHVSSIKNELAKVEKKNLELRDKRSMLAGSKSQFEKEMLDVEAELKSKKKIYVKYADSLGRVVCNNLIISDLEKLKECFETSITTFHNDMIVKINQVLRVKWRQIYCGSDIDTIELVDEEITRGKDKRAYNYYIAMKKGGVKMKMREKSSTGQKALAAIILRMTLAELFVKDFAFIALDEPTASLDQANVQSLARAIGSYVKKRSAKGVNIQWIIITHDEQFLKALDGECSPHYYRVQLDNESCSKIIKTSFTDTL